MITNGTDIIFGPTIDNPPGQDEFWDAVKAIPFKTKPRNEGQIERTKVMGNFKVLMKLVCGPVMSHTDGVIKNHEGKDYINKQIVLNAQYGNNPEDNNYAVATPNATLNFSLQNPHADIFAPGRKYKVTIEEWED